MGKARKDIQKCLSTERHIISIWQATYQSVFLINGNYCKKVLAISTYCVIILTIARKNKLHLAKRVGPGPAERSEPDSHSKVYILKIKSHAGRPPISPMTKK